MCQSGSLWPKQIDGLVPVGTPPKSTAFERWESGKVRELFDSWANRKGASESDSIHGLAIFLLTTVVSWSPAVRFL